MNEGMACLNAMREKTTGEGPTNPCPVIPSVARGLFFPAKQQISRYARDDIRVVQRSPRELLVSIIALSVLALAGCAHRASPSADMEWKRARQAVVVVTPDWNADHGTLHTYERSNGAWHEVGARQPVMIGRKGSAWGIGLHPGELPGPVKQEGDGRSPAGVFGIGEAFGYAEKAQTALPYAAMQASHYCMDVSASPLYNRIVDTRTVGTDAVAGSTEPMRLDLRTPGDQRYRLGFVIEHNPQAKPNAGSCIFAHLWKRPGDATAGCTAMADSTMDRLQGWLRPDRHPVFVLMPAEQYRNLHVGWNLPALDETP
jgi:L,D-peptidoglycan transpeptidase YkuD (ErfK/YbiS/YcfS/YnhG family)